MGTVEQEMQSRLKAAFDPSFLCVTNDSASHAGHMGDDGSGESHFSVEIEAAAFAGLSRVARQRAVNAALADLLAERVHALALSVRAPGDMRAPGE